jgi:multiple sugar transport system substrate-binding protein
MADTQYPSHPGLERHHSRPFGRRRLLRGAGVLGAALVTATLSGCDRTDDALTFFFQANPEEAAVRMRVVDEFQRRHPGIKVRMVRSGGDPMQQIFTFVRAGNARTC